MRLHLGFTSPVGVLPKVVGLMRVCLIKVGFIVLTIYVPCMCAETGLLQQLNKMRAGTVQGVHQSSQKKSSATRGDTKMPSDGILFRGQDPRDLWYPSVLKRGDR